MFSLFFLGSVSFLLSLFLTPLVRESFRRWGLAHRGSETTAFHPAIPRGGGVAIVVSYIVAYACLLATPLKAGLMVSDSLSFSLRLLPTAGLIFIIGLVDDL